MIRALLLIARSIALAHDFWIAHRGPLAAEIDSLRELAERLRAENALLRARLLRLEPHRRPHFKPWERLAILWHRVRYGLSLEGTARAFVLSVQTLVNWTHEVDSGVRRLVHSREPLNRLPDLVREILFHLKREWPRWGTRRIAGILARIGVKASRTSVQRLLRKSRPRGARRARALYRGSLRARGPCHVYVLDFTVLKSLFRSVIVGVVLDAFSRKVLALRVWKTGPTAEAAGRMLQDGIQECGLPKWVVTDRGTQFTANAFGSLLRRRGICRRFARLGEPNLSRIDRFWRSMKEEFARGLFLWRPLRVLKRELGSYVRWYNVGRPHEGLRLRTPDEVFQGRSPRKVGRVECGRLEVRFEAGHRNLPIFRLRAVG